MDAKSQNKNEVIHRSFVLKPHEGHGSFLQLNLQLNYSAASLLVFTLSSTNGKTHHQFTCCVVEYHILFFSKSPKALRKVNNTRSNPSAAKLSAAGINTHKHTHIRTNSQLHTSSCESLSYKLWMSRSEPAQSGRFELRATLTSTEAEKSATG